MATGRTSRKWARVYMDGYDLSAFVRTLGPLSQVFATAPMAALSDGVAGVLPDHGEASVGTLAGFLDNTASGLHTQLNAPGTFREVLVPIGIRAAPAQGDPAFGGAFEQLDYQAVPGDGFVFAELQFGNVDAGYVDGVAAKQYRDVWGVLLHARGDETAGNTAIGVDDNGGTSAFGGLFCYQLFSSNGTVTVAAQDAATNTDPSFAGITGASSGVVNASVTPVSGIVGVSRTLTIRRFLRWQLVLGTATTCNFASAFIRGRG